LATQVEADQATAAPTAEPDLLGDTPPVDESVSKEKTAKESRLKKLLKKTTSKSDQIALFTGEAGAKKKPGGRSTKPTKAAAPRKPK
ncbi:MAG TPA: hypothetical protein VFT30_04685, partial [Nitrospira sp.]|nr:hypothetical protein [Nitrospira sp.]